MNVQAFERFLTDMIERETGNVVEMLADRIQNAILNAIDNIFNLVVRSKKAPSARDTTSVTANSEGGEHISITASFQNVSDRSNTSHQINTNDEI